MSPRPRSLGVATVSGREDAVRPEPAHPEDGYGGGALGHTPRAGSPELFRALAEVKGQAQFLLYLADQIEDSLRQLGDEADMGHAAFLCKVLGMYSAQLESKHQGLGDRIAETCQEVYITVREFDLL
jgi:hypothetical protein